MWCLFYLLHFLLECFMRLSPSLFRWGKFSEAVSSWELRLVYVGPIQERLVKCHGIQCGFCSPGMVMSLYALLRNNPHPSQLQVEQAVQGITYSLSTVDVYLTKIFYWWFETVDGVTRRTFKDIYSIFPLHTHRTAPWTLDCSTIFLYFGSFFLSLFSLIRVID